MSKICNFLITQVDVDSNATRPFFMTLPVAEVKTRTNIAFQSPRRKKWPLLLKYNGSQPELLRLPAKSPLLLSKPTTAASMSSSKTSASLYNKSGTFSKEYSGGDPFSFSKKCWDHTRLRSCTESENKAIKEKLALYDAFNMSSR